MDSLKRFFVELPRNLDFKEDIRVKVNVYKALYFAATNEGEFLDHLFNPILQDELELLKDYKWLPSKIQGKPFYHSVRKESYSHSPDQICGRIFKRGEPVYRCFDCAYDDTCVLCSYCFNPEDHKEHTVSFYYASEDLSGMCDCGDELAFPASLKCPASNDVHLDPRFEESVKNTFEFVFDYILDVTNYSISMLPFIHNNIDGRGDLHLTTKQLSELSSLPIDRYKFPDINSDESWYLILWNDEHHDYDDACCGIRAASGVSQHRAKEIAEEINRTGRAILKWSNDYSELLTSQKLAEVDGLVATIMSARDYRRECLVSQMLSWVSSVLSFTGNSALRAQSRKILADLLLRPGHEFAKLIPSELFKTSSLDVQRGCFECGIVYDDKILDLALTKIKPGVTGSMLNKPIGHVLHRDFEKVLCGSMLQYLLLFEVRFPLHERKLLEKILLPTLTATEKDKAVFCDQYIDIYPTLLNVLAFSDREEQLSSMPSINVQLFTCPKTNERVVRSGKLGNILGPLSDLIENHSSRYSDDTGYPNIIEILVDLRSRRQKSSIDKAITSAINDISHIVGKNNCENILESVLSHNTLCFFLVFQKYFQGALPVKRKYGEHVERELFGDLLVFLQRAVPMLYIVKCVFDCGEPSPPALRRGLQLTMDFLSLRKTRIDENGEISCQVSKDYVSLLNPVNSFLSYLIQNSDFSLVSSVYENLGKSFFYISDFSLRSIVLSSQIKIGLWIRNGLSVSRQAAYYSEPSMYRLTFLREYLARYHVDTPMSGMAFSRDFHLCQVVALLEDPVRVLDNFLDRWELKSWFHGDVKAEETIYEERFDYACEQLIYFLYCLVTDRLFFEKESMKTKQVQMRNAICYALCEGPRTYSNLILGLGKDVTENGNFEEILTTFAEYQPPSGLTDSGVYRLKTQWSHQIDPISLGLDSSQFHSVMESLVRNVATSKKCEEAKVVLNPVFTHCSSEYVEIHLSDFTKTNQFAKFIYKLLQHSIHSKQEVYIHQLLHLIHALLLLNISVENFVNIPICDLLLSIAESEMSRLVLSKADFLLSMFIQKDVRVMEALVDCFGEEHIQLYRKRKASIKESSGEKRKKSVEDKKAKILRKIERQREQFLQKNPAERDMEKVQDDDTHEKRICVVCGEPESDTDRIGILVGISQNSIKWKVPHEGASLQVRAFSDYGTPVGYENDSLYKNGYPYRLFNPRDLSAHIASSCAHGIHWGCFQRQKRQLDFVPCPLCHNLYDSFLPTFDSFSNYLFSNLKNGSKLDHDASKSDEEETKPTHTKKQVEHSGEKCSRSESILKQMYDTSIYDLSAEMELLIEPLESFYKLCVLSKQETQNYNNLHRISLFISDTIKAGEVSSRLEYDGYFNFLEKISSQTKALLRALIRSHACLNYLKSDNQTPVLHYVSKAAFEEVILKFLLSESALLSSIKEHFLDELARVSMAVQSYIKDISFCENLEQVTRGVNEELIEATRDYMVTYFQLEEGFISTSKLKIVYHCLERALLEYLRQCFVFWDIITCEEIGTNSFTSSPDVVEALAQIQEKTPSQILTIFCSFFGILSLSSMLAVLSRGELFERTLFQEKMRDNGFKENHEHLDYPGTVSLVELPKIYNECIIDPHFKRMNVKFDCVCLACGEYLKPAEHSSHTRICTQVPIYYSPYNNDMTMIVKFINHPIEVKIAAPYLTIHGEVKRGFSNDKAVLSVERYKQLNKLWIDQGLLGFATRSLFGASFAPNMIPRPEEIDDDFVDMDDEDDELAEGFFAPYDPDTTDDF